MEIVNLGFQGTDRSQLTRSNSPGSDRRNNHESTLGSNSFELNGAAAFPSAVDSSRILSRAFALVLTNSKRTGVGRIVGKPEAIHKRACGKRRTRFPRH